MMLASTPLSTVLLIFLLLSTALLAFVAAIWSSQGALNIAIKLLYTFATVLGAICSASLLVHL